MTCLLTAAGGDAEDVALGLVTGLLKKAGLQSKEQGQQAQRYLRKNQNNT